MAKRLLSGGEAIAHAALAAGASVIAGYPTDSLSELVESALRQVIRRNASGAHAQWTVNDKTTLGICAAASLSGFRALAAFGQTGFSETIQGIAALNNAEIQGGLVVVVADAPASDAFTTNLDVRRICELAKIPVIDPGTPELAFTSVSAAFTLSENYGMPVVVHISADINYACTFFDIQTHTKAVARKGNFLNEKESLDVADLVVDESQDSFDISGNRLSDIDARLKEIAYKFSYKDIYATYNRIHTFEQQYEGKHNSRRFLQEARDLSALDGETGSQKGIDPLDESNIKIGICACGSAAPYALEAIETLRAEAHKSKVSAPYIRLLTLGTPYPVPKRTLRRFLEGLSDILVIEEFSSFAEEELNKQAAMSFLGPNIHGRFTDEVNYNYPINFESTILHIAAFIDKCLNVKPEKGLLDDSGEPDLAPVVNLGKHSSPANDAKTLTPKQSRTLTGIARRLASPESIYSYNYEIPERPPVLCSGCPHRASFYAIERALERLKIPRRDVVVSGDVGCSLLGNNPPLNFLDAYLGEGFSASLAQGFSLGMPANVTNAKSIAILGDSSFFADAIPSITNAVVNDMDVTIIVLDNKTCAESGLQPTPTTNGKLDTATVLHSLGIQNVRETNPFEFSNAIDSCVKALRDTRPSAVVLSSKCARLTRSGKVTYINPNKCTGCMDCITQLGCPAISFNKDIIGKKSGTLGQAVIDINQCNGCRLCIYVCQHEAIRVMTYKDVADLIKRERYKAGEKPAELVSSTEDPLEEAEQAEAIDKAAEKQEETITSVFASGPLLVLDDEPEEIGEPEEGVAPKEYRRADFGTLFGGKNAELRLDFGDADEILEEAFEADIEDSEDTAEPDSAEESETAALEEEAVAEEDMAEVEAEVADDDEEDEAAILDDEPEEVEAIDDEPEEAEAIDDEPVEDDEDDEVIEEDADDIIEDVETEDEQEYEIDEDDEDEDAAERDLSEVEADVADDDESDSDAR